VLGPRGGTKFRVTHRWGDYWRFTSLSARRTFESGFPEGDLRVEAHGNVLAATAFLHGLSTRDLRPQELDFHDPDYEVLITVRAVKARANATQADDDRRRIPAS
jgi:hypothetical protein